MPPTKPNTASPSGQIRRQRSRFLGILGHTIRIGLLAVTLIGLTAGWMLKDSTRAQKVQDWYTRQLTNEPRKLLLAAEQALAAQDHAAAKTASLQFMTSIPLPLPVDALGEPYRRALKILRDSAEKSGDMAARLRAGEMALEFDPRDSAALTDYARALQAAGQPDKAIAAYEAAFAIRPFSTAISEALAALHLAAGTPAKAATVRTRHLEAVALCLTQSAWLTGNLVSYGGGQSSARDVQLAYPEVTELNLRLDRPTDGAYLVLKSLPHIRYIFERAELRPSDPAQPAMPLGIEPQQNLERIDAATVRSVPASGDSADGSGVINLRLPASPVAGVTLFLRIRVEPDETLAPWVRSFGTWLHPRVPVATGVEK